MRSFFTNMLLVARREYLERVRAKSFMVMTILIPLLMGGLIGGSAILNSHLGAANHIAVITSNPQLAPDLATELTHTAPDNKTPVIDVYSPSQPGIRDRLNAELKDRSAALDGYLVETAPSAAGERPHFEWVPRGKADIVTRGRLASAIRGALVREKLTSAGMGAAEVSKLLEPVDLASANDTASFASAYGMFFLMYFVILFYGMNVARSIIEEKTSRIFEVLLASIRPEEMLAGKVIGVGAVGLTQVGIWIAVGLVVLKSQLLGADMNILPSGGETVLFVIYFLLGYLLYSSVAAALGAITNSEQELQQMNIFLMLPLIACTVIIMPVVTTPDSLLAKVFSLIPFTSPLIMYTRVIVGKPGIMAVAISIALLVATIALVLWLASRIYRVGILMYGKKPNLPEILRWLRYS